MRFVLVMGACIGMAHLTSACATEWLSRAPAAQKDFIAIIEAARRQYQDGKTDLQKGAARPDRADAVCRVLKSRRAEKWLGKISVISTNSDGKGVIEVTIADKLAVGTWNNALSDVSDKTLVDPRSAVFKAASKLAQGDIVVFSGSFPKSDTDCVVEKSMTMRGSIQRPEYAFRFSYLEPEAKR